MPFDGPTLASVAPCAMVRRNVALIVEIPVPALSAAAAARICGTLGYPSKMPGTSYGIPASACKVGSILRRLLNSTCSKCYAFEGNYQYSTVAKSQATRLASITDDRWVEAMVASLYWSHIAHRGRKAKINRLIDAYALTDTREHRWHDAGDVQSRDHLCKIVAVARATPWLRHWLPTREVGIVKAYERDGGTFPPNLIVRVSAAMIDGAPPRALPHTSTVHSVAAPSGSHVCPAPLQGNNCGPCRACWSATVANVSYHVH